MPDLPDWRIYPRNVVVVTDDELVATSAVQTGRRVLYGSDSGRLMAQWSALTGRATAAIALTTTRELAEAVGLCVKRAQLNAATGGSRSRAWALHILENLPLMLEHPPAMALAGKLSGVPAWIVGAGPSMARTTVPDDRGVVIAVNSGTLHVIPHFAVNIEANDMRPKMRGGALLAYGLHAMPECFADGEPMPVFTGEISKCLEPLIGHPRTASSVSGTSAAVSLAHVWGCDPIVLVGQDLAWTGGKVYAHSTDTVSAEGVFSWSEQARAQKRHAALPDVSEPLMVPGWGGGPDVQSSPAFDALAGWLASFAAKSTARCINATGGGRHIQGWEDCIPELPASPQSKRKLHRLAGGPTVSLERMRQWYARAPELLLEPYAMPEVAAELTTFGEATPRRSPWAERRARIDLERRLAVITTRCREELATVCRAHCP